MFKGLADLLSFVEKFSSIFGQVLFRCYLFGSRMPAWLDFGSAVVLGNIR